MTEMIIVFVATAALSFVYGWFVRGVVDRHKNLKGMRKVMEEIHATDKTN